MANSRRFTLEQVREGDVVFISACSQCCSKATIKFEGLDKELVLKKEDDDKKPQRLAGDFFAHKTGKSPLAFTIDITGQSNPNETMKVIQHTFIMPDKEGKEQGLNYVYNIEDVANGDEDFNDYYINVVAWHKEG